MKKKRKLNVRRLRTAAGMTQERVAKLVGVKARTVSRWENGKSIPSPMAELMIRKVFRIDA